MQGLNRILGKQSHLLVLRVLHAGTEALTGREIQRRCGLSNRATMQALESLEAARVVHREASGQAYLFRINARNYLWSKAVKPALDSETDFWEDLRKTVRRLVLPQPEAAMVTGALAREEALMEGTLELHLLFSDGRQRLRAYRCVERLKEQIRERYALETQTTFMDIRTMDDPEFQTLWRRIAREGVLLYGKLP